MASDVPLPRYLRTEALLVMCAASGALLCLAFPPADWGPLVWLALVPLFFALSQTRTVLQGGLCGLVFGVVFFAGFLSYFTMWGLLPWLAAATYQGLYFLIFGLLAGPIMRRESPGWRVAGAASAWALVSWLRANAGPVAFSGGDLAYSQYDQLPLLQMVSVVGQLGMTFCIAAVNAALSQALLGLLPFPLFRPPTDLKRWSQRSARVAVVCYGAMIVCYLLGAMVLKAPHEESGRPLKVALVQGNVPLHTPVTDEDVTRSQETYLRMNQQVPEGTELTIWPESAFPGYMPIHPGSEEWGAQAARTAKGQLILGTLEKLGSRYYNAARLYDKAGRVIDRYHKMDLVIYGEYVPLRERMPWLEKYPIRQRDLTPGQERKLFTVNGVRVAPLICFEGMFSRPTREVCRLGAQVIAILTSDAWAQGTCEAAQHSPTAALRAVEARRYLCRAATTGQSAIYDPYGQVLADVPLDVPGVISETVYSRTGLSVYHRVGDMPLVVLWLLLCVGALWRRK